ncbi:unnamed protein product [Cuscuta campestris]|uniref:Cytochrome c domain-containing protein n=1 Tax=Cuscuta campestris TaxID=132261 RepID=A0A484N6W0_9ASTE|nr:unnamed protein product [Cuscuta campestris]
MAETFSSFEAHHGNSTKGYQIYSAKCAQCHDAQVNAAAAGHKQGPNLNGLFGRQSGTTPSNYSYSASNKDKAVVWREETLSDYLLHPKTYIRGTKMDFPGLKKAQDRADLIAYLHESTA